MLIQVEPLGNVANNLVCFLFSVLSRQHICLYSYRAINFSVSVQIITLCDFHLGAVLGALRTRENTSILINSVGCDPTASREDPDEEGGRLLCTVVNP